MEIKSSFSIALQHLVRDCPRKKNSDERKKRGTDNWAQKEHQHARERQQSESTGDKFELQEAPRLQQQANMQPPISVKLPTETRTSESKGEWLYSKRTVSPSYLMRLWHH